MGERTVLVLEEPPSWVFVFTNKALAASHTVDGDPQVREKVQSFAARWWRSVTVHTRMVKRKQLLGKASSRILRAHGRGDLVAYAGLRAGPGAAGVADASVKVPGLCYEVSREGRAGRV